MYDPDHPEISGSITPPSDRVSTTDRETLVDFLRRLNERLRGEFVADAEAVVPLERSTGDARGARAGSRPISGRGVLSLIVGFALGLLIGTLLNILMLPLGEPDAAEIPFALGLLLSAVAVVTGLITLLIGATTASARWLFFACVCLGISGGWAIVWLVIPDCFECRVLWSRLGLPG